MSLSGNETVAAGATGAALLLALNRDQRFAAVTQGDLTQLPGGVSHIHFGIAGLEIEGCPPVARVPVLSQWDLEPGIALAYEAAAFERAAASARTPRLLATLPPAPGLDFGALIVERIDGPKPRLPADAPAIADTLAALHLLPVPPRSQRPPLWVQEDAVVATLAVIDEQAAYLDAAMNTHMVVGDGAGRVLTRAIAAVKSQAADWGALPPVLTFVGTDTHPGNFLMRAPLAASFVDLEKAMYGHPAIDLAHATLYTSTRWDADVASVLTPTDIAGFHERYFSRLPAALADAIEPWVEPMRRLTWLRTTSWAVRWAVRSRQAGSAWGGAHISDAARTHMEKTVADYLSGATMERLGGELELV